MLLWNLFLFLLGWAVLWRASGLVIGAIEKIARSVRVTRFAASFLILGLLTSVSEMSVGLSAVLDKKPGVFVGNLVGASFVLLVLVIPLLAVLNRGGVKLDHSLNRRRLLFFVALAITPAVMILDQKISRADAWIVILLYAMFFYSFQKSERLIENFTFEKISNRKFLHHFFQIIIGIALIYGASIILVDQTVLFATLLSVPPLLISLLLLSLGTNLPEIAIAVKSIKLKKSSIAFGDYIGSTAANTLLFGILSLMHGPFTLENVGFDLSFIIMLIGYYLFYRFSRSKNRISTLEGALLILVCVIFVLFQTNEILTISPVV